MTDDSKRKIGKYVRGAVKWGTAAAVTKVAFDVAVTPAIRYVSDVAATMIQDPVMEVVEMDQLAPDIRKQLARVCIVVLGPKQSGKSSLLRYLAHGAPTKGRLKSSLWETSDTFQGVISVSQPAPTLWKQIIQSSAPTAIVYMADARAGASSVAPLLADLGAVLSDAYRGSLPPRALYVLLNYADQWSRSPSDQRQITRSVEDALSCQFPDTGAFVPRTMRVAAIQLSPSRKRWPEAKSAIDHLGADLTV